MISINANTRIAELLRGHPAALETIIGLSPRFAKLRNPFLRKLMAGRTSIAMASKVGGCTVDDFFCKLRSLGFVVEEGQHDAAGKDERPEDSTVIPEIKRIVAAGKLVELDVRPVIEGGKDPLVMILAKIKTVPPGFVLKIVNSFEPSPLIILLGNKGFQSWSVKVEDNLVYTYFLHNECALPEIASTGVLDTTDVDTSATAEGAPALDDWDDVLARFADRLTTIDVRPLDMPKPMLTILRALDGVSSDMALFIHHKRIPVFLLPELAERGFEYRIREISEGDVKLLIFKK
jgi:hypothetical protein